MATAAARAARAAYLERTTQRIDPLRVSWLVRAGYSTSGELTITRTTWEPPTSPGVAILLHNEHLDHQPRTNQVLASMARAILAELAELEGSHRPVP
jgi:hypothetical protein